MKTNSNELNIASVGQRIAGGLIDLIITFALIFFFGYLLIHFTGHYGYTVNGGLHLSWLGTILASTATFIIFALMEYATGKTPGKYAVKTKVVTLTNGKISFLQAFLRNIFRLIDGIAFYLFGLIVIACDKKKRQRLGDLIGNTVVISQK